MAKITQLPVLAVGAVDGSELIPIVKGALMRQVSLAALMAPWLVQMDVKIAQVQSIADRIPVFPAATSMIPLCTDDAGNVPLWLDGGKLGATGLTPELHATILAQTGLKAGPSVAPSMVPLIEDGAGNVPVWLDAGKLDALGVGPNIAASLITSINSLIEPRTTPLAASVSTRTDKRSLTAWRDKIAQLKFNNTGIATLLLTGDSWMEYPAIPAAFAQILHALYGKAGNGFVSVMSAYSQQRHHNTSIVMARANWTDYDANTSTEVPASGCALDGNAIYTTGTTATLTLSGWNDTDAKIYYSQQGTGSFRWRIGTGAWSTVTATGAGGLGILALPIMDGSAHTLEIDTTVNTGGGTVSLFGFNLYNSAGKGVLIHKCGNAGMTGSQLAAFVSTYITPMAADLAADAVNVIMSTNDYRIAGNSPANLITQYRALSASYRAGRSDTGFVFAAPPRSNGVVVVPQNEYRDAISQFCLADGHAFYNGHDLFDSYAVENSRGTWAADGTVGLHLSAKGGFRFAAGIEAAALSL